MNVLPWSLWSTLFSYKRLKGICIKKIKMNNSHSAMLALSHYSIFRLSSICRYLGLITYKAKYLMVNIISEVFISAWCFIDKIQSKVINKYLGNNNLNILRKNCHERIHKFVIQNTYQGSFQCLALGLPQVQKYGLENSYDDRKDDK